MFATIIIGVLVLIALGGLAVALFTKSTKNDYEVSPRQGGSAVAGVFLVLALIVWLSNSIFSVEARTVGIVTEFGQATGTVNPGFNFLAPWAEVTEFPTSNQNIDLDGRDGDNEGKAVEVKFDGGGTGYVNVNVNWKVMGNDEAIKLWNEWKDFDKVKDQVVTKRVQGQINEVVGAYAPQDAIKSANYEKIAKDVQDSVNNELDGKGIEIVDVNVLRVDVDKTTQNRINQVIQADTGIDIAEKNQDRAAVDEETNKMKERSLTPGALVDKCLSMVDQWDVTKNGNLPAGFSCFGGQGLPLTVGVK